MRRSKYAFDWHRWIYGGGDDEPRPTSWFEAMFRWCLRRHGWHAVPDWVMRVPGREGPQSEFFLVVTSDTSRIPDDMLRLLLPRGSVVVVTQHFQCARYYVPTEITGIVVANVASNYREEGERLRRCSVFDMPYLAVSEPNPGPEHITELLKLRQSTRASAQKRNHS